VHIGARARTEAAPVAQPVGFFLRLKVAAGALTLLRTLLDGALPLAGGGLCHGRAERLDLPLKSKFVLLTLKRAARPAIPSDRIEQATASEHPDGDYCVAILQLRSNFRCAVAPRRKHRRLDRLPDDDRDSSDEVAIYSALVGSSKDGRTAVDAVDSLDVAPAGPTLAPEYGLDSSLASEVCDDAQPVQSIVRARGRAAWRLILLKDRSWDWRQLRYWSSLRYCYIGQYFFGQPQKEQGVNPRRNKEHVYAGYTTITFAKQYPLPLPLQRPPPTHNPTNKS